MHFLWDIGQDLAASAVRSSLYQYPRGNYNWVCTKVNLKYDFHITGQLMENHPEYSESLNKIEKLDNDTKIKALTDGLSGVTKESAKTALGITDVADAASDLTDIASRANSKVDGFGSAIKGVWNVIKANPLASGAIGAALTNYLVSAQGINYLIYQSFKGIQKGTLQNRCIAMSLFFTAAVKLFLILLLIQV